MLLTLSDVAPDNCGYTNAHSLWQVRWKTPGGDVIPGPVARWEFTVGGARDLTFDATELVKRWIADGEGALHLRARNKPVLFGLRTGTTPPRLVVDGVEYPCTATCNLNNSSSHDFFAVRWQLPTSCNQATITVRLANIYASGVWPLIIEAHAVDLPIIATDPAKDVPGAQVAFGPGVGDLCNDDLSTDEQILADYLVTKPISQGGVERIDGWLRCWFATTNQRAVQWRKLFQPDVGKPWQRPYEFGKSLGYDELFMQYRLRIGEDVRAAFNETGMKLPGLTGSYAISTLTQPMPTDAPWYAILWHNKPSPAYPHLYRLQIYWSGSILKPLNKVNAVLKAGQAYTIEQQIRMNTLNSEGAAAPDGVVRVWVDGVLSHEETNIVFRKHPSRQIDNGNVVIYHGGTKFPLATMHYDLADLRHGTKYIGIKQDNTPPPPPPPDPEPEPTCEENLTAARLEILDLKDDLAAAGADLAAATSQLAAATTQLEATNAALAEAQEKIAAAEALSDTAVAAANAVKEALQ